MHSRRKIVGSITIVLLVLVASTVLSTTASGSSTSGAQAVVKGSSGAKAAGPLIVDWAIGNATLDPASACSANDAAFIGNFYERLVALGTKKGPGGYLVNDSNKILPALATSWKIGDRGTRYTFTLKRGAKFSDGSPMNAAAVKYSIERLIAINGCASFSAQAGANSPSIISSVAAPNATTVVITLRRPYRDILVGLATPWASIVNPRVVERNGGVQPNTVNPWMASHVAGGGPFLLKSYQPSTSAVLVRNPRYHGKPAASREIRVTFSSSVPTLLLRAQNGQSDISLGLPASAVESLAGKRCCKVVATPIPEAAFVAMKNTVAPFDNVKFREALTVAIPYPDILKSVVKGRGSLFYGPILPELEGFNPAAAAPRLYNPARAKTLLDQSGVVNREFELMVDSGRPVALELAPVIQGALAQVGVKVNISQVPSADFSTRFNSGRYQAALNVTGASIPTAGYFLEIGARCGGRFNNASICVPGLNDLLDQAQGATTKAGAQRAFDGIALLWRAQSPTIMLYGAQRLTVLNKRVKTYDQLLLPTFAGWSK